MRRVRARPERLEPAPRNEEYTVKKMLLTLLLGLGLAGLTGCDDRRSRSYSFDFGFLPGVSYVTDWFGYDDGCGSCGYEQYGYEYESYEEVWYWP